MDDLISELMGYQNADRATTARVAELVQAIRNAALEEAAQVCEARIVSASDWDSSYWDQAAGQCAHVIRALKTSAPHEP